MHKNLDDKNKRHVKHYIIIISYATCMHGGMYDSDCDAKPGPALMAGIFDIKYLHAWIKHFNLSKA